MSRRTSRWSAAADAFSAADFAETRRAFIEAPDWETWVEATGELGVVADELVDPRIEIHAQMPLSKVYHGRKGFLEHWREWFEPWEGFEASYLDWKAAGDKVLLELEISARGTGSGVPASQHFFHLFTVRGGRVVRLKHIFDEREAVAAIGDATA